MKIFFLYIFIQKVKVTPLNQFRELQILWLFPARSSDTGTAGTGIEILGSFSARPLAAWRYVVFLGHISSTRCFDTGRLCCGDPEKGEMRQG